MSGRSSKLLSLLILSILPIFFNNCSNGNPTSASQTLPAAEGAPTATPSPAATPVQVVFPGIGSHGIGDPSLAQDSSTSRVWLTYTAVDPSPTWPNVNTNVESTRLGYSDNGGVTWTDSGLILNAVTEATLPLPSPNNDGSWVNETSQLVYDPGAPAGQHYKMIWQHYLLTGNTQQFADSWLAMKMADTPLGLATATEIKLFGGNAYDTNANLTGTPLFSPVSGAPQIFLNSTFSQLSGCAVFSEPGMYATSTALYLTTTCSVPATAPAPTTSLVVLLKCLSPCNVTSPTSWSYVGTLFNMMNASTYGFDSGFTASSLFQGNDGNVYVSVTPQESKSGGAPLNYFYEGCYIFKFTNLDSGTLSTVPTKVLSGATGTFNGACAYNKASSAGVMSLDLSGSSQFQIFSSGINF